MAKKDKAEKRATPIPSTNSEQLVKLKGGAEVWNAWRDEHLDEVITLYEADLKGADLRHCNLRKVDLRRSLLQGADLSLADLSEANLSGAVMYKTKLDGARLQRTNMTEAYLMQADLRGVDFGEAILSKADFTNSTYSDTTVWPVGFNAHSHGARTANEVARLTKAAPTKKLVAANRPAPSNAIESSPAAPPRVAFDFTVTFDGGLSASQIRETLGALAQYYRACGGVGLQIDLEAELALVREPVGVLA